MSGLVQDLENLWKILEILNASHKVFLKDIEEQSDRKIQQLKNA